jgi:hypothetical protein
VEHSAGIRYLAADDHTNAAGSGRETVLTAIAASATHCRAATGVAADAPIKARRSAGQVQGTANRVGILA